MREHRNYINTQNAMNYKSQPRHGMLGAGKAYESIVNEPKAGIAMRKS